MSNAAEAFRSEKHKGQIRNHHMPHDEMHVDRLVHYFAGECSEEEEARIEAWIHADPERKRRVARLRRVWEAAEERPRDRPDVDAMWDALDQRLGFSEREDEDAERGSDDTERRSRRARRGRRRAARRTSPALSGRGVAVAAAIAVVIVSLWAFWDGSLLDRGASGMRTITTEVGERAQVRLGDGTQVTLNVESTLMIPPEFGDHRREVTLQGQAYFEVEPDEERPFLVHADGSVAKALGTKFGVGAYPGDGTMRVVVAEGKVAVRSAREKPEESVTLTEKQMASLSESGGMTTVRQDVDLTPHLAWTDGQLVFRNASFKEVTRRLRSWYGLRVALDGSPGAVDRLNATFTDEPISEVLTIIAETLNLRYEREEETVTFYVRE